MSNITKITLHNESTVSAKGKKRTRNAKPVFCIDTGDVYVSSLDAAQHLGVSQSTISWALTGRTKRCKGKRLCLVADIPEYIDEIRAAASERESKVLEYDKIMYKQTELDNAKAEVAKHRAKYDQLSQKLNAEFEALSKAEKRLAELEIKED